MSAMIDPAAAAELLAREIRGEFPDARGRFGPFGGRYVPETLIPALDRLEAGMRRWLKDPDYQADLARELNTWVGRPTPLSHATTLSARWGADNWMKREHLAHTGAHKINSAIGQALLAKRLGAKRVVAETGAGQHGVASAAACARLGLPVTVYMGAVDIERQAPNVGRMKLMGATVKPVTSGDQTLRAAVDEALRDWVSDPNGTYYLLGSAIGPHPYPYLVRELQAVASGATTPAELERAKAATASSVLMNLESRAVVAEDIGRQVLTYGERKAPSVFLAEVARLTPADLAAAVTKLLKTPPSLAVVGDAAAMPRYEAIAKRF